MEHSLNGFTNIFLDKAMKRYQQFLVRTYLWIERLHKTNCTKLIEENGGMRLFKEKGVVLDSVIRAVASGKKSHSPRERFMAPYKRS